MKNRDLSTSIGDYLENGMIILSTALSSIQAGKGLLFLGKDFYPTSKEPSIWVFKITDSNLEWHIEKKIDCIFFFDYNTAIDFVDELPNIVIDA